MSEAKPKPGLALYLIWGEEFLVRQGADELVKAILPDASVGLNLSVLDGGAPKEIAQDLATLPLFPGAKVVLVRDPEFLAPKKGRGDALGKARDAWKAGKRKEGARRLLALVAKAGFGADALDPDGGSFPSADAWREELNLELGEADLVFFREVALFCREENVRAPEGDATPLVALLQKGLPKGQVLVVAATDVDPKHPLFKLAKEGGGLWERKVSDRLKDLDLSAVIADVLAPFGKRLAPAAEAQLKDRCGGNIRLVQSELEKLALYSDKKVIDAAEVALLVDRAREEEFLELSDALQRRDLPAALRYVEDALSQGSQPLQLLGAIASIVRTLLEAQDRMNRFSNGQPPRGFDDFKQRVFPKVEEEAKARKGRVPHPYAAFMGMQAATRFGRKELWGALRGAAEADLALKSGGGRLVVERLLWRVCEPPSSAM